MKDLDFVPYEQALELKQLGFDEPCIGMYNRDEKLFIIAPTNQESFEYLCAPIFSQAFRWFREKYGINSHIHQESRNNYSYCCGKGYSDEIDGYQDFKNYEEAELECLKQLIKIVRK